jgi:hypothetical protein
MMAKAIAKEGKLAFISTRMLLCRCLCRYNAVADLCCATDINLATILNKWYGESEVRTNALQSITGHQSLVSRTRTRAENRAIDLHAGTQAAAVRGVL